MSCGCEVGIAHSVTGKPVAGAHEPPDVTQMVADVMARNTDHVRVRGTPTSTRWQVPLIQPLRRKGARDLGKELVIEPARQPAHLDSKADLHRQQALTSQFRAAGLVEIFR